MINIIMITSAQKKKDFYLFIFTSVFNIILNGIYTYELFNTSFPLEKNDIPGFVAATAVMLILWANIFASLYYYFSESPIPSLYRMFLYVIFGIFSLIGLGVTIWLIVQMIECDDSSSFIPLCPFWDLLLIGLDAITWCYCGANIFIAYVMINSGSNGEANFVEVPKMEMKP